MAAVADRVVDAVREELDAWRADVERRLARLEELLLAWGRPGANGTSEPAAAARREAELAELRANLEEVLREVADITADPSRAESEEGRRRIGDLRLEQANLLFRMGDDAPGGCFPPGEHALGWR